jgi:hypothetical protein
VFETKEKILQITNFILNFINDQKSFLVQLHFFVWSCNHNIFTAIQDLQDFAENKTGYIGCKLLGFALTFFS